MQANTSKKRRPFSTPPGLKSVEQNGIRYSSPEDEMGYIIATDISTNKTIWTKQIYKISVDGLIDQDFSHSFINELYLNKNELRICNQNKETFYLDINSRKVSKKHFK